MKFSYSWLRDFVDPGLAVETLAHQLTMAGIEVEQLTTSAPFAGIVAARVVSMAPHPEADRLKMCQVDVGAVTLRQIVCGAPDVAVGMLTACALPGAVLADKTITAAEIRGVASSGMLCSAQELGLPSDAAGLIRLDADVKPGSNLAAVLGLDEAVFTLKLTPNRSDCLSVFGVAREVAAVTSSTLKRLQFAVAAQASNTQREVSLETTGCARYCGRTIEDLNVAAVVPRYIAERLASAGMRGHSAVVDITNYVMLEIGQPLHAFDVDKLDGGIAVREARAGEKIELLNQSTVTFLGGELLICDAQGPIALAGVMGGAASAVVETTRNVFLESAFFLPSAIAGMTRRYNVSSDSAYRFERGVDFAATRDAIEYATALILEICGGRAGPVSEAASELPRREPILLRHGSVDRLLGIQLPQEGIFELLRRLNFAVATTDLGISVTPPSFRFDLAIEVDLIEEVARLYGYDNITAEKPRAELAMLPQNEGRRDPMLLADILCARDYQEIVSYSFVEAELEQDLSGQPGIALQNPIASQMSVMRATLIPGLIQAARFNIDRQQTRIRLFEIGRCFNKSSDQTQQPWRVGGLCLGPALPEQWGVASRAVDFYDVKADIEALIAKPLRLEVGPHPAMHPGQSARILCKGQDCGWLGTLHPKWQHKYGLRDAVIFELDREVLLACPIPEYKEVSKFPSVIRDIACIVEDRYVVQVMIDQLLVDLPQFVKELTLFDIYRGKGIDSGKKSLAFRIVMQDTEKTLSEAEIERVMDQISHVLTTRFGAALRI